MLRLRLMVMMTTIAALLAPVFTIAAPAPDCNTFRNADLPADSTWAPSTYYVEVGQLDAGHRYVLTEMMWDDVSGFGPGSTYEADFLLYNYAADGTYLNAGEVGLAMPHVIDWNSNLPAPYLDTRFGDPGIPGNREEVAHTVGAGRARDIRADTLYYTLVITTAGPVDTDEGRLSAQLGCQIPTGCTSTWCSFGARSVDLVPAWQLSVPGSAGGGTGDLDDRSIRAEHSLPEPPAPS